MGSPAFFSNHLLPHTEAWVVQTEILKVSIYNTPLPSGQYVGYINALIAGLIADGNWQILDRMWIFTTEQQQHAWLTIVNPTGLNKAWPGYITEVNMSSRWSTSGYNTDGGASEYLDTGYSPSNNATHYAGSNCSFGFYCATNNTPTGQLMGCYGGGGNYALILPVSSTGHSVWAANDSTQSTGTNSYSSSIGLWAAGRNSSNTHAQKWLNGASPPEIGGYPLNGVPTETMYIGTLNNSGSPLGGANVTIAMAFTGSGSINQLNLYSRINTFLMEI